MTDSTDLELTMSWRDDAGKWVVAADLGPDQFLRLRGPLRAAKNELVPGSADLLPEWASDAPLGLIAYRASLCVRNVVVTPLP